MNKRRFSVTASEEDVVPVIASYLPERKGKKTNLPKHTHLAMLSCDDCNTQVLASNYVNPFCVCCASDNISPTSDKTLDVTNKNLEEDFSTVGECPECETVIAVKKDIEASFDDGKMYCPCCTSAITLKADDEDEEESDDEDENTDSENTSGDADMSQTVDDTGDDSESGDNLFDNVAGEGGDDTESSGDVSSNSDDSGNSETSSDDSADKPSESDAPSADADSSGSTLNANLMEMIKGKEGDVSLAQSPDKTKWFLFFDNKPIASASKDAASENVKNAFDTEKFSTAWTAATADGVTEDVLNEFGFTPTTTEVPVEEAVKQNLEASINEFKAKNAMTAADIRNRFDRCFGIAATGINKQVFRSENPVKKALIASLKGLRIRDAERIVTAAFDEHGEEYLGNVSEKASELMDKSDETLDQLAETVDGAKYTKTEEVTVAAPKQPNVTPFPKVKEDKINDEVDHDNKEPAELAASDIDGSDKLNRMFRSLRNRN